MRTSRKSLILAVVLFLLSFSSAAIGADAVATKVLVGDDSFVEITNTGVLTATSRLYGSDRLPADVKTQAIEEVLAGASASGMLVATRLVAGDSFFALDSATSEVIVVTYTDENSIKLPDGSYGFSKLIIPHAQ